MHRVITLALASVLLLAGLTSAPASTAAEVGTVVEITGVGVQTYPAYDEAISRYGIRTTTATAGQVAVRVVPAASGSTIRINGRVIASGVTRTIGGLSSGDEINVQVSGGGTSLNQSWVYLPDGFPTIDTTSTGAGPAPGMTAVTLQAVEGDSFATMLDSHGVPAYVGRHGTLSADFNRQPNGHYSLAVALTEDLWGDYVIEEYDESFRKVDSHQMIGQPKTDFHDTILLPGGGRILMAYIQAQDGQTDSWLQEIAPGGQVLLDWNSRDHVDRINDPVENALGDYAHLNSVQVMQDGNLLLSFRHLNQVMKIDRETGDVIWRLGGKQSTTDSSLGQFSVVDDPLDGPCAQHTARELANGDIQIFDNGSGAGPVPSNPMCPNPADPDDPYADPVYRAHSRVTTYHLDESTLEAQLVSSHEVGAFSQFAGSAQRLGANTDEDHFFVGLNNAEQLDPPVYGDGEAPDAIEFDADGNVVWSLNAPGSATYRAAKVDVPDRIKPQISITSPIDGATVQQGQPLVADFGCTDTGGSNLAACSAGVANGASLSGEIGTHQLVILATDLSGNSTTRTVTYTVTAPQIVPTTPPGQTAARADATIRKAGGAWKGNEQYDAQGQTVKARADSPRRLTFKVKIRNRGNAEGRFKLAGSDSTPWARVRWFAGKRDVTSRVSAGTYRTSRLAPGSSTQLRLVVRVLDTSRSRQTLVRLKASGDGTRDVVRARILVP